MPDLSKVLGDVYGGGGATNPPPAEEGAVYAPPASTAPTWADESRLDEAFANWNPGPGPDAPAAERDLFVSASRVPPLDDDLAAALSEALADAPAPAAAAPAPAPELSAEDDLSAPAPATTVRPSPSAAWLADVIRPDTRPVAPPPVPAAAEVAVAPEPPNPEVEERPAPTIPLPMRSWQRDDDDVLVRSGGRGGFRLNLRRR